MIKFEDFIDEVVSNFVDELHREAPELEMEDVWSEEEHRLYTRILLWPGEEIPDLIGDLLTKVREGDEAAIKRFLFVFSDPKANGTRSSYLGSWRRMASGDIELETMSPWLDDWEEAHDAKSVVSLSPDNRVSFRLTCGSYLLPMDRLVARPTGEETEVGQTVYRIG